MKITQKTLRLSAENGLNPVLKQLNHLDQDLSISMSQMKDGMNTMQILKMQKKSHERTLAYDMVQTTLKTYQEDAMSAIRNLRA